MTVTPNITGVAANQAERSCLCVNRDCSCVADATILDGGARLRVLAFGSPFVRARVVARTGRTYLIRYTGVSETGLTCEGVATVCVHKQPKDLRGQPPPACDPFESTFTVRDATKCGNFTRRNRMAAGGLGVFEELGV